MGPLGNIMEMMPGMSGVKVGNREENQLKKTEAIIRPVSKKVDDLFCKLHRPGIKPVTLKAMDDAIRNRVKDKFK